MLTQQSQQFTFATLHVRGQGARQDGDALFCSAELIGTQEVADESGQVEFVVYEPSPAHPLHGGGEVRWRSGLWALQAFALAPRWQGRRLHLYATTGNEAHRTKYQAKLKLTRW